STTDQDLLGQTRTVNAYLVGTNFFMIDASRSTMFNSAQSVLPNEPVGVIWTIDGQNKSPKDPNFEVIHVTNTNNNWTNLQVSAHYNAGQSFEYFRQTYNRNSLNGDGGNIISLINIADDNGNGLDNAFWNGSAMFYGNGDVAFGQLAKGLDVAGHEMSHGVIQNTANLEYVGQSGALNESFADVFGSMIDRNDWQIGEDVVNTNFFPSGALRDLSDPHNGGAGPNDNAWQPAHMNEYQNLPNTPEGDNGGVHVNSGIPNRAFFLFASVVGKQKAEQVYYKALRDYLVKSSQFIDMRNAVEKAATDLHGANSAEVIAARNAFDGVGIGAGQGDDHQDDIELNTGDDFILATDEAETDLYWIPPSNPDQFKKMDLPAPLSKPSFTDDGTAAVYVDQENNIVIITFDWSGANLDYQAFYLEDNPQGGWRNVVVSKDGSKIAFTTSDLINEVWVFDFTSEASQKFLLFNPTTATGIETGDVLYADAMEWDYSGEFIMYDALNRIESTFGDGIEYWDISFLNAWKNSNATFGDGMIGKLFTSLPENVSVGNPAFAKNSPYIITFDYVEDYLDQFGQLQTDYRILASNIETGVVNEVYLNTTVGYPSYSGRDDKILFTFDNQGVILLATINMQPGDKTVPVTGTDVILINGAQKGVWFQTGDRNFTSTDNDRDEKIDITLAPQPASNLLNVMSSDLIGVGSYKISNLSGKILQYGNVAFPSSMDISMLPAGMYFLQLETKEFKTRKTFIKL
ncbi:MAG TPA: M4 family metallopeptidase, partial [Saprospiraceae bacterium]|nr:M4 family metallopeptidase [Saprospiraceae bacterium]